MHRRRFPVLANATRRRGVALVIVLALVVLVTGLVVAFFSRALSERQISNSSAGQTRADLFAQGAYNEIIGDLQQEIAAGSSAYTPPSTTVTIYTPNDPVTAVPFRVGTSDRLPNLIKRSASGQAFYTGGKYNVAASFPASNRAINVPSTTASAGGRTISLARWNKAMLLPKQNPSQTDATPLTGGSGATAGFVAPDWVLVARDGSNPTTWNSAAMTTSANNATSVVGRYAYTIYNEGGLLDANAAGYPTAAGSYPTAGPAAYPVLPTRKSTLAYADLTVPTTNASDGSTQPLLTAAQVNTLVGWRNYASGRPSGAFPGYMPSATPASPVVPAPGLSFFDVAALTSVKGFLSTTTSALYQNQSDRGFGSRQQLIDFLLQSVAANNADLATLQNSLQYLGTYSRTLSQPSYVPAQSLVNNYPGYDGTAPALLAANAGGNNAGTGLDVKLNPAFPAARVLASFSRFDGSVARVGEPLVKKRFALNRLAWITCKGPSASRATSSDADIVLLKQYLGGDPAATAWLQQGTPANIQNYFGLSWHADSTSTQYQADGSLVTTGDGQLKWFYDQHNSGGSGPITRLYDSYGGTGSTDLVHLNREPDFFELLKASVHTGAVGKTTLLPSTGGGTAATNQYNSDSSVDFGIIQLGANIIDQFDTDNFPTRIVFNDGVSGGREFRGVENLPYINRLRDGLIKVVAPVMADPTKSPYGTSAGDYPTDNNPISDTGVAAFVIYPELWNPHDYNTTANGLVQTMGPAGMGPTQFRTFAVSDTAVGLIGHTGGAPPNFSNRSDQCDSGNSPGYNSKYGLSFSGEIRPISRNNTEMDFTITQDGTGVKLFREPTILFQPGKPVGSSLSAPPFISPSTSVIGKIAQNPSFFVNNGLRSNVATTDGSNLPVLNSAGYIGFYVGSHPLQWMMNGTPETRIGAAQTGILGGLNFHYFVQCMDALGQWASYDEKYEGFGNPNLSIMVAAQTGFLLPEAKAMCMAPFFDPRTSHFGTLQVQNLGGAGQFTFPPYQASDANNAALSGWMDQTNGVVLTDRNGTSAGSAVVIDTSSSTQDYFATPLMGWHWKDYFRIGLFAQNNPNLVPDNKPYDQATDGSILGNGAPQTEYYTDADGVVRRGMGAFNLSQTATASGKPSFPNTSTAGPAMGLPAATANYVTGTSVTRGSQSSSRPQILNRPFYSPTELGYVFSGTPWKQLSMMQPESGYGALLDVFCVQDSDDPDALVGGRVDLNTRQTPVLQAILAGAYKDELSPAATTSAPPMGVGPAPTTGAEAQAVASALVTRTSATTGPTTGPKANAGPQPLRNVADLVGRWAVSSSAKYGGTDGSTSYDGFSADLTALYSSSGAYANVYANNIGRYREAGLRALADGGQTRVWNLLIDVVAQTGRYPLNATNAAAFSVEGEQRYWVHLAIDRVTGQVLDKQVEVVKE